MTQKEAAKARGANREHGPGIVRSIEVHVARAEPEAVGGGERVDTFAVSLDAEATLVTVLAAIDEHPVTTRGDVASPIAWEAPCLEGVCGLCTILVNGRAVQACTTRVSDVLSKRKPLKLAPLAKLPLVQDLIVDRSEVLSLPNLEEDLALLHPDAEASGSGARMNREAQAELLALGACTGCGACLEACPEFGGRSAFMGPALLNAVEAAARRAGERAQGAKLVELSMDRGGVQDCGKAEVCVEVCPAGVPLLDAIQRLSRRATLCMVRAWFSR